MGSVGSSTGRPVVVLVHGEGLRSDPVPEDCFVDTLTSEQQNAIWRGVLFEDPSAMIRNPPRGCRFRDAQPVGSRASVSVLAAGSIPAVVSGGFHSV